jgi:RNA polymerase sigma-70 factor (ECF subfamily)
LELRDLTHIIDGCIRNDRSCQEKLYREYYPALYSLCRNFFSDQHDILTALNNGMLNVFKHVAQYDRSKGEFFNWVYTIVRHSALTLLRDRKVVQTVEMTANYLDAQHDYQQNDEISPHVVECLEKLPPTTRVVCHLFYIENFTLKEIAQSLDIKDGTVKWHLSEGRNKIKSIVNPKIETRATE